MYNGVTGFTDRNQVLDTLSRVPEDAQPQLMVGVLASHKTIRGLPAGNPKRYPKREEIEEIFVLHRQALNLVHYNTQDQSDLYDQLRQALAWGGPACDGLQLNIVWPRPDALSGLRQALPGKVLVFQVNRGVLESCAASPDILADRICAEYGDIVDYVLVDGSMGKGIPLNPGQALAYLLKLEERRIKSFQCFGLGVAGGLCGGNVADLVTPIRTLLPEVSIDAEGALRTDDLLDGAKVGHYLDEAFRLPEFHR